MNAALNILAFLYAATGVIATIGYFPTMKDLYFHKIKSANVHSYIIWTICAFITVLYAVFLVPDLLLILVTGINFLCCAIILILALRLK